MIILAHSNRAPRRLSNTPLVFVCVLCCFLSGCKKQDVQSQPEIAVANSYLQAVVEDLCGDQQEVLSLVPPGMCPGHFDISPSQVNCLCHCKILFVFDFQQNIENAIPRIKEQGLKVCTINPSPGLCIPDTYLKMTRQVAAALCEQDPARQAHYEVRLQEIEKRLENTREEVLQQIKQSGLTDANVMTSAHQAEFAKWLGLNPVSTFAGRDTVTPAEINNNLTEANIKQVKLVIANQQEGTKLAQALAQHLNVKCVVFSNFPLSGRQDDMPAGFDGLIYENVNNLFEAIK